VPPKNNSQKTKFDNIKDSIIQESATTLNDKAADKLYGHISNSFTKDEITFLQAQNAKYVPKVMWRVGGALNKLNTVNTAKDIYFDKNENWGQKTITDGPRLLPGWLGVLGELWNTSMDFILKIKPPNKHPLEMMWEAPDTSSQTKNIAESQPLQTKGVLNGQNISKLSSSTPAFDAKVKQPTRTANTAAIATTLLCSVPTPMIRLNPIVEATGGKATSVAASYFNGASTSLTDAEAAIIAPNNVISFDDYKKSKLLKVA